MGYLDYNGLSHFKDKLTTIFAPIVHTHNVATTSTPGFVQPDNTTITINNGVISASGGSISDIDCGTY